MPSRTVRRRCHAVLPVLVVLSLTASGCRMLGFATPEPITLRFAYRGESPEIKGLLDQYMETHRNVTVESVIIRPNSGDLRSLVSSQNIDVFRDSRDVLGQVDSGFVRPLDELQLAGFTDIRNDYYQGTWEAFSVRGRQWAIPAGLDVRVAYVNVTHANALGVRLPSDDWDLYDLLDLANSLNYPEGLPSGSGQLYGFCSDSQGYDPIIFIYMHGGRIVDDFTAPTRATLDDAATIEAVQWYSDLFNRYGVAPKREVLRSAFPRGGVYEGQIRGACGVWLGWYSDRGGRQFGMPWTVEWKMLPLPQDVVRGGFGEVDGYYITANSAHPEEAIKLVRFLSDSWQAAAGQLPPRTSLAGSVPYARSVGDDIAAVAASIPDQVYMVPTQVSPLLESVALQLFAAVQTIIIDDLDAADVLMEVQDRLRNVTGP